MRRYGVALAGLLVLAPVAVGAQGVRASGGAGAGERAEVGARGTVGVSLTLVEPLGMTAVGAPVVGEVAGGEVAVVLGWRVDGVVGGWDGGGLTMECEVDGSAEVVRAARLDPWFAAEVSGGEPGMAAAARERGGVLCPASAGPVIVRVYMAVPL